MTTLIAMRKIFSKELIKSYLKQFILVLVFACIPLISHAELPVPDANNFVSSGLATFVQNATTATINQTSDRAILNWQSFNIGKDNTVNFVQPSATSTALNRIQQGSPSQIFGNLNANGQVYLINSNGILFGEGAQINVGGLTASTLDVSDQVFNELNIVTAITQGEAAFEGGTADLAEVKIENGATITTPDGGRVLMFAPKVSNEGKIITPEGQTILGGVEDKVYLYSDSDSGIRGLLVELGTGGSVENLGEVIAERGNITLIGQAVRQAGSLSATTSVQRDGSIRLIARDGGRLNNVNFPTGAVATTTGDLVVDENSSTEVLPDYSSQETAADNVEQALSTIELMGKTIHLKSNAKVKATGGQIFVTATETPGIEGVAGTKNESRILMEAGSIIDATGDTTTDVSVSRYQQSVEVRSNELADLPVQKGGVLQDEEVLIDVRIGTDVVDASNVISGFKRTVTERLSVGGSVELSSGGDVLIKDGATIDVSGGSVNHQSGVISTTALQQGEVTVNIADADPNVRYDSLVAGGQDTFVDAYIEGKDGGNLTITSHDAIIEGTITGNTVKGRLQREVSADLNGAPLYSRNFQQLAKGSSFILDLTPSPFPIGRDVVIAPILALESPGIGLDSVLDVNHLVSLNAGLFNKSGIADFQVLTEGDVNLMGNLSIEDGGSLIINSLNSQIDGSITARGGDVQVISTDSLLVSSGSDINVAGLWVNDALPILEQRPSTFERKIINGGVVNLSGSDSLVLSQNTSIDVSGGGYIPVTGDFSDVTSGNAGSITLAAQSSTDSNSELVINNEMYGYSLLGGQGGSLSVITNAVEINSTGQGLNDGTFYVNDQIFSNGGFGQFNLTSTRGGVMVDSSARVNPVIKNYMLNPEALFAGSDSSVRDISSIMQFEAFQRSPVSIGLSSLQSSVVDDTSKGIANLVVEEGASITLDAGGEISLVSDNSLYVDGYLAAPSGNISLEIIDPTYSGQELGYLANQSLWLGNTSELNVAGTILSQPNATSFTLPDQLNVLDAGNINLAAERGYIIGEQGSVIDVSGVSATSTELNGITFSDVTFHGDAGSISISSGDGIILGSTLSAVANPRATNGYLGISLTESASITAFDLANLPGLRLPPDTPRIISIGKDNTGLPFTRGGDIDDAFHGMALLDFELLNNGNFDSLNFSIVKTESIGVDSIEFTQDVNLSARQRINMDAQVVDLNGNNVSLASNYLALGPTKSLNQFESKDVPVGDGKLTATSNLIDLIGDIAIFNANEISLISDGDLRLIGAPEVNLSGGSLTGSLNFFGNLDLTADQVYPSSFTQYSIINQNDIDGRINFNNSGNPDSVIQSVLSTIDVQSPFITNDGVIKAPGGEINLIASQKIELGSNSITSTSLEGNNILLGRTEAGDWVYQVNDNGSVFTEEIESPLDSFIELNSEDIVFADGAVLDISGGGDFIAYEHIPGPNGTFDILDPSINPDYFAVIPTYVNDYGVSDHIETMNQNYSIGSQFILNQSSDGLPAGTYTILPAHYALLPGAFLVRPEPGYQGIVTGRTIAQADGSNIIAGRISIANTQIIDDVNRGFSIVPQASLGKFAEYNTSGANTFFDANLPNNAKRVTLAANSNLDFQGIIEASANNGRAGFVDIISNKIAIVDPAAAPVIDPEFLLLNANALRNINAQSIAIGGSRESTSDGTVINTQSSEVILSENTELTGNELLLIASENVSVQGGARLEAIGDKVTGTDQEKLILNGDGALLRVSSFDQVEINRQSVDGLTGNLVIADNSVVGASNSITIDATNELDLSGDVIATDGSLNIASNRITLGADSDIGLSLGTGFFDEIQLGELVFTSRTIIDIADNIEFDLQKLIFDAPQLITSSDEIVNLTADNFVIKNSGIESAEDLNQGSGSLFVNSLVTEFGGGTYSLSESEQFTVTATEQVAFSGDNNFKFNGQNITINTSNIVGESGASLVIDAETADLAIISDGLAEPIMSQESIVSSLSFLASSLLFDSNYRSAGGRFNVVANNDIIFADNANVDVSGAMLDFVVTEEPVPGGVVDLFSENGIFVSEQGSLVDFSADDSAGDAGSFLVDVQGGVFSSNGEISGNAAEGYRSGKVDIKANSFDSFSDLNTQLNDAGAFEQRFLRAVSGDIVLVSNDVVKSEDIALIADQGSILVQGGIIDASGVEGGNTRLVAFDEVRVEADSVIDISAQSDTANNAGELRIDVASNEGKINLLADSVINFAGGTEGGNSGSIIARIQGNRDATDPSSDLSNRITWQSNGLADAASGILTAFLTSEVADAISQADIDAAYNNVANYLDGAKSSLINQIEMENFQVMPGLEILSQSINGITTTSPLDFTNLRFDGLPGEFTLRSVSDLDVVNDITDGFDGAGVLIEDNSWAYNLVAGAELASPDIFATQRGVGDLTIGDNVKVRTGTGDINLFSGNNIILTSDSSVIYTAGNNAGYGTYGSGSVLSGLSFGKDGGDVTINAQGDFIALTDNKQFVNEWLYRWGDSEPFPNPRFIQPTMWIVNFDEFNQGIGIFGGGNAILNTRGNAENVSISIPTVAISQSQGPGDNTHDVLGGGNLEVNVGGDLQGAEIYVERGVGDINVNGSIGKQGASDASLLIGMGDSQLNILSGSELNIDAIVNPFLLPQALGQQVGRNFPETYYTTYTEDSSFSAASLTGAITYDARSDAVNPSALRVLNNFAFSGFGYVPGKIKLSALQNDILLASSIYQHSNPTGNLDLNAWGSISSLGAATVDVQMLANDLSFIPNPLSTTANVQSTVLVRGFGGQPELLYATTPVHLNDFENSKVVARNGNIEADGGSLRFLMAEPTDFYAGNDVVNANLRIQHSKDEDASTLVAGRDIIFPSLRSNANGALRGNVNQIVIDGKGLLEVIAGRDVDLGLSAGISTAGNINNPFLDDLGADVSVFAGVAPGEAYLSSITTDDLMLLIENFVSGDLGNMLVANNVKGVDPGARSPITDSSSLQTLENLQAGISTQIIEFAANKSGETNLTLSDASVIFDQSSPAEKRPVFTEIISETVETSARLASTGGAGGELNSNNFDLAFGVLELFHPEDAADNGNLTMFNSAIRTLEGGDISVNVPYGQIDAGLPSVAAGARDTDQIGIITQREGDINIVTRGDVNVNRSRIFALGGGDMLFWSSLGSVDAGRGAQDSLEIPPPTTTVDANGNIVTEFPPAISGSGIRTASTIEGVKPGDVIFGVPNGVVDSGDAGIDVGGSLVLAAEEVIGRDNFSVGGDVSGVQLSDSGPPIALTTAADSVSAGVNDSVENTALGEANEESEGSLGSNALKWLEVFVIGYGDETASLSSKICDDESDKCEG